MKRFFAAILLAVTVAIASAQTPIPEYQIEGAGTGTQGTYLINITALTNDSRLNDSELAKCAVHGVIFRGFSNSELRQAQKPIATDAGAEAANADFFKKFFADGGAYLKYVATVNQSRKVIKSGKKYKISSAVTVNKEQLRKDLEAAGVIRSLNSIF